MNAIFLLINLLPILFLYQYSGHIDMSLVLTDEFILSIRQTYLGTFFAYLSLISIFLVTIAQRTKRLTCSYFLLQLLLSFSMLLIVFAGDFITLFIGWEIMTWSSYFLISKSAIANTKTVQKYILFSLTLLGKRID